MTFNAFSVLGNMSIKNMSIMKKWVFLYSEVLLLI